MGRAIGAVAHVSVERSDARGENDMHTLTRRSVRRWGLSLLAGAEIDSVLDQLDDAAKRLFENNLVAQYKILHGLLAWLEHCLEGGLALHKGQSADGAAKLREAKAAFAEIRQGQALASRGVWENWYRGDRKMNLGRAEDLTEKAIELAAGKVASSPSPSTQ